MNYVNNLLNVFKLLGINVTLDGDKFYFSDIATGEKYDVLDYDKHKLEYYDSFNLRFTGDILLQSEKFEIRRLEMRFGIFSRIIQVVIIITDKNEYVIKYLDSFNRLSFKMNSIGHKYQDDKKIEILRNGIIRAFDKLDEKKLVYNSELPSDDLDYDKISSLINANKYFDIFMEYYLAVVDTKFMEVYNNFQMDSATKTR